MNNTIFTVSAVSARLNLSRSYLYKQIEQKRLPHYKIGARVRISEDQIQEFLKKHMQQDNGSDESIYQLYNNGGGI